jgi:hypothetical protein
MRTRSTSASAGLRILSTVVAAAAAAALLATAAHLSSEAMSSTTAGNGTINIGTHPPNALLADSAYAYWHAMPMPPHPPIIKG